MTADPKIMKLLKNLPFAKAKLQRFKCTQCGDCCSKWDPIQVFPEEIAKIREKTGHKNYTCSHVERSETLYLDPKSRFIFKEDPCTHLKKKLDPREVKGGKRLVPCCIFLTKHNKKFKCQIYDSRPSICRGYPYETLDVVGSALDDTELEGVPSKGNAFLTVDAECNGVGKGKKINIVEALELSDHLGILLEAMTRVFSKKEMHLNYTTDLSKLQWDPNVVFEDNLTYMIMKNCNLNLAEIKEKVKELLAMLTREHNLIQVHEKCNFKGLLFVVNGRHTFKQMKKLLGKCYFKNFMKVKFPLYSGLMDIETGEVSLMADAKEFLTPKYEKLLVKEETTE